MVRNASPSLCETNLRHQVLERLGSVVDPCMEAAGLGLSLVDLGIVRSVEITDRIITVELGLTEPGCGFTHVLVTKAEDALEEFRNSHELRITFNWSEPWTDSMMTETGHAVMTKARARGIGIVQRFDSAKEKHAPLSVGSALQRDIS